MMANIFTAVVENVNDPEQLGRFQIRIFGYHNSDINEVPVKDLPWAQAIVPVTASGLSGVGSSPGITAGVWVVGFFQDGAESQNPVIIGALPGYSTVDKTSPKNEGFKDPNGIYPISTAADIPKEARANFNESPIFTQKNSLRHTKVPVAVPCNVSTLDSSQPAAYFEHKPWDMPDPLEKIQPAYPHNRVHHTVSGHSIEYDDTPGFERISEFHKSGTYREIYADGESVTVITGKRHTVILQGDNLYIEGDANITITGNCRQLVKGNYHLEVDGEYTEKIKGSKWSKVGDNEQTEIGQSRGINIQNNDFLLVNGKQRNNITGDKSELVNGICDFTSIGQYSLMSLGGLNCTSASSMSFSSPDVLKINSASITFDTKTAPLADDGITWILGANASCDRDIITTGDVIGESGRRRVSLNFHTHSETAPGGGYTLAPNASTLNSTDYRS